MAKSILDNGTVLTIGLVGAVAAIGAAKRVRGSRSDVPHAGNRGSEPDAVIDTPFDAMRAIKGMPKSDFYVIGVGDDGRVMGIEPCKGTVRGLMRCALSMGEATTSENMSPRRPSKFIVVQHMKNINLFSFDSPNNPYQNVSTHRPVLLLNSLKMADWIVYDESSWMSSAYQGHLSREWQ